MTISERRDELVKRGREEIETATEGDTPGYVAHLTAIVAELCGFLAALDLRDPEPKDCDE